MKNILAIIASPRRLGNCEIFAKEITKNLGDGWQLKMLRLSDFDLLPCRACYHCLITDGGCEQSDDLNIIIDAMARADAFIVASPVYFLGPNAELERLHDRGLAFYQRAEEIWNKPSIAAVIGGIEGKDGFALLAVKSFLKSIISDIRAAESLTAAFPGEIVMNTDKFNKIKEMAKKLLSGGKCEGYCPLCGGDTFRFLESGRVQCALCSNFGEYEIINDKIHFNIYKDNHELFLSRDQAEEHRLWLRDMKLEYKKRIRELSAIRDRYKDFGIWIKPSHKE
ncbi:MAG: NAD(P)H-dependent oxidoreductase [Candidatus Kapaibacterium sp.]